jgi:hypothetical protein
MIIFKASKKVDDDVDIFDCLENYVSRIVHALKYRMESYFVLDHSPKQSVSIRVKRTKTKAAIVGFILASSIPSHDSLSLVVLMMMLIDSNELSKKLHQQQMNWNIYDPHCSQNLSY